MMLESHVREAFEELTSDPPAFHGSVDGVLVAGRQARRRRGVRLTALSVPVVVGLSVVAVVGAAALAGGTDGKGGGAVSTVQIAAGATPQSAKTDVTGSRASEAVRRAVAAASPTDFTLDIDPIAGPVESEFGIDGTANDGNGAGRVYVVFDPQVGVLESAPCTDPEFVAGGTCTSTVLPDGNTLVLRGQNGTTYTQVLAVVIHPDGTGTTAESDNGTFPHDSAHSAVVAKERRSGMEHVTRADPTYTVEQLGRVAVAADQAATQCVATQCNAS
jgi:hypothetical protein